MWPRRIATALAASVLKGEHLFATMRRSSVREEEAET